MESYYLNDYKCTIIGRILPITINSFNWYITTWEMVFRCANLENK